MDRSSNNKSFNLHIFTSFGVVCVVGVVGVVWRVRRRLGRGCSFGSVFLLGCNVGRSVGKKCVGKVLLVALDGFLWGWFSLLSLSFF